MARIPILDESDPGLDPEARAALEEAGAARGKLVNFHRALANHPAALRAVTALVQAAYRKDSSLEPRHAELAYLTATATNDCYY